MLRDLLLRENALKKGNFVLSSGKISNYYVDIKDACARPDVLEEIVKEIKQKVQSKVVAGVELGAVPLVIGVAYQMKLPYFIIRKETTHGMKKLIIGNMDVKGPVDIIEDVVTTGGSVMRAINLLSESGYKVNRVITVVDREDGGKELLREHNIDLISLLTLKDVF
jgi:orotate phosphoribosyltransferase